MEGPLVQIRRTPRLSIVVPVSRSAAYVEALIASAARQTAPRDRFELVLVTDDDARYDDAGVRVRVVRSPSRHPCAKRNLGAEVAASQDLLAFIDDDVVLSPGWVEAVLDALAPGATGVDVVTGPSNLPYSDELPQRVANAILCSPVFSLKSTMSNAVRCAVPSSEVSLCNVAMRRAVFARVGGFNEVAPYWIDDAEFFFLAAREGFGLVNDPRVVLAHWKRPVIAPMLWHYFRQRWHGGQSTWVFPELYLPQRGVQLCAATLVCLVAALTLAAVAPFGARMFALLAALGAASMAALAVWAAWALSPAPGWRARAYTGVATAVTTAGTVAGFWCGLLWGPVAWARSGAARAHKAWRYRDRDVPYVGEEVSPGLAAQVRATVPARMWTSLNTPQWLIFFITARCNARCSMCFYWEEIEHASEARELTLDEVRRIARKLPKMTYLSLSGGEPFLRRDLVEIVQAIVDAADPVFVSIPTNGAFPERVAAALAALSLRNPGTFFDVHLSVDGPAEVHDKIRRTKAASYAQVMATHAAVAPLAQRRGNVGLKFVLTVSTENVDVLGPFIDELAATKACDRVHLVPLHGTFKDRSLAVPHERYIELAQRAFDACNRQPRRGFRHRLFAAIKRATDDRLQRIHDEADLGRMCGAGERIVVLGPYGDVLPCEPLQKSVGNLRDHDYDLAAVLRGDGMRAFADAHLGAGKCNCNWGCAIGSALVRDVGFYPAVAKHLVAAVLDERRRGR